MHLDSTLDFVKGPLADRLTELATPKSNLGGLASAASGGSFFVAERSSLAHAPWLPWTA